MLVAEPQIIRRNDVVQTLQKLLRHSQHCEQSTFRLFAMAEDSFHRELAVKLWQQNVHHVAELQATLKRYGGDYVVEEPSALYETGSVEFSAEELHRHVRHTVDSHGETLSVYEDALKREWPVDVRSLLKRHLMQCKDILNRLEISFLHVPRAA